MANEVRIKDLELNEELVEAHFDAASFPVDLGTPNKTLRVRGSFWNKLFHPFGGRTTLDFKARDLTANRNTGSAEYIAGMLGVGWNIDEQGHAEMRSLKLWERLVVPELVKNQIHISRNETWFTDGGTIETVRDHTAQFRWATSGGTWSIGHTPIRSGVVGEGVYAVAPKEPPSFRTGDLIKSIVERKNGFDTAHMRVDYLLGRWVAVRSISGPAPEPDMVVARVGNDTNKERQGSLYADALGGYLRVLAEMDSFTVRLTNIKFQGGNLSGLRGLGYNEQIPTDGVYAPGLYIGADQVAGLGAIILALEDSISLKAASDDMDALGLRLFHAESELTVQSTSIAAKVNVDGVVAAINLDKSGAKIKGEQITLEGTVTANNNVRIRTDGTIEAKNATIDGHVVGRTGEFWGHVFTPYTETPDTTTIDGYWNLIGTQWNVFDRGRYFVLPTDASYIGATISIINTWFEPSKSATGTVVKAQGGKIYGIGNSGSGIGAVANTVSFIGQEMAFIGSRGVDGRTQWIVRMGGINNITTT